MKKIITRLMHSRRLRPMLCRLSETRVQRKLAAIEDPTERTFSEIYLRNTWGGKFGEFYSGGGSRHELIAEPYVSSLRKLAEEFEFDQMTAVDLGCGDMSIGRRICPLFQSYVGVDICKELIEQHREQLASSGVSFQKLNIVKQSLPGGDVCMVRQVFQHLSNDQICKVLPKLMKYKYLIFTEHLPYPDSEFVMNLDISEGAAIRLTQNSGVFLEAPPFGLDPDFFSTLVEVPSHGGVVRTVLYEPHKNEP